MARRSQSFNILGKTFQAGEIASAKAMRPRRHQVVVLPHGFPASGTPFHGCIPATLPQTNPYAWVPAASLSLLCLYRDQVLWVSSLLLTQSPFPSNLWHHMPHPSSSICQPLLILTTPQQWKPLKDNPMTFSPSSTWLAEILTQRGLLFLGRTTENHQCGLQVPP